MIEFEIGDRVQVLTPEEMLKKEGVHENDGVISDSLPGLPGFVLCGMDHLCGEIGTVTDYRRSVGRSRQIRVFVDFDNKGINWQGWHYAPFMFKRIMDSELDSMPELSGLYGEAL